MPLILTRISCSQHIFAPGGNKLWKRLKLLKWYVVYVTGNMMIQQESLLGKLLPIFAGKQGRLLRSEKENNQVAVEHRF